MQRLGLAEWLENAAKNLASDMGQGAPKVPTVDDVAALLCEEDTLAAVWPAIAERLRAIAAAIEAPSRLETPRDMLRLRLLLTATRWPELQLDSTILWPGELYDAAGTGEIVLPRTLAALDSDGALRGRPSDAVRERVRPDADTPLPTASAMLRMVFADFALTLTGRATCALFHDGWCMTGERMLHPLAPVVRLWLDRRTADTRRLTIMPSKAAITGAPLLANTDPLAAIPLPDMTAGSAGPLVERQDWLPDFAPPPSLAKIIRPCVFYMFDQGGGLATGRGRGATLEEKAFVFTLLSIPTDALDDVQAGRTVTLELPADKWGADLFPGGWQRGERGQHAFRQVQLAMDRLARIGFEHGPERGLWRPVALRYLPRHKEDRVVYDVRLPPGPNNGFLVDRHRLRAYGATSAPAFRAYLALRHYYDHFGTVRGMLTRAFTADRTRLAGADRYPVIPDEDLWGIAFQSNKKAKYQQSNGPAAVRAVLQELAAGGDVVLEDALDSFGNPGVRLLPPPAKSREKNALTQRARRQRREQHRQRR